MDGEYLKVEVKCQIYYADFFVEILAALSTLRPLQLALWPFRYIYSPDDLDFGDF